MSQRATIICVDDEKTILDALKEQLNRYFKREYTIETAENAEKALEIYKELMEENLEVPVIISDHIMPGMKGDELLKQIYLLNPRIKKILLTGQADADAVGRAVNYASLYRYIPKPWEQHDLTLTIQEAIRSYYMDKTLEEQNAKLVDINDNLTTLNAKLEQKIILFNKFVPSQFLKILKIDLDKSMVTGATKDQEDYIELAQCAERELTVMFSDIRSFTSICESLTSSEAFEFINSYLCEMGPIISQYNGFIDKFIGDAIMALFTNADDAVLAGIAMQNQLAVYNQKLELKGQKPIAIGIGINTDTVMLGTLGEVNRLQTTVIGDAVNLSQRTEKKSKEFGTKIVITENTYKKLGNYSAFKFRYLDRARVKGKNQMLDFFEVLNIFPEDIQLKKWDISDLYNKGVAAYHNQALCEAESLFNECLKLYPEDFPSQLYLADTRKAVEDRNSVKDEFAVEDCVDKTTYTCYLKFWGTRGSSPVAGREYSRYGGCTSCLELRNNEDIIIFDAGSGIRTLGEELILENKREVHLIISHFHWDHIAGFPFFLPIYNDKFTIHIYAPGDEEMIREQFSTLLSPQFFPVELSALKAKLTFNSLNPNKPIQIGNVKVLCCKANHPGLTYCYRVEMPNLTFGYATDNEFLLAYQGILPQGEINLDDPIFASYRQQIEFFKGCEFMIHEAQYLPEQYQKKTGWGHSSIDNAIVLMRAVKPKHWILTHHDPDETDNDLMRKKQILKEKLQHYALDCELSLAADGIIKGL